MIERVATLIVSMRLQGQPAHDEADKQARQRQKAEREEVGVAHLVGDSGVAAPRRARR